MSKRQNVQRQATKNSGPPPRKALEDESEDLVGKRINIFWPAPFEAYSKWHKADVVEQVDEHGWLVEYDSISFEEDEGSSHVIEEKLFGPEAEKWELLPEEEEEEDKDYGVTFRNPSLTYPDNTAKPSRKVAPKASPKATPNTPKDTPEATPEANPKATKATPKTAPKAKATPKKATRTETEKSSPEERSSSEEQSSTQKKQRQKNKKADADETKEKKRRRVTPEDSRIMAQVGAGHLRNWNRILQDSALENLSQNYDPVQIKQHINYLKRKDNKPGRGEKHRDQIVAVINEAAPDSLDVTPLEPDQPPKKEEVVVSDSAKLLQDQDKKILSTYSITSDQTQTREEFSKFQDIKKTEKQQQRESNIAKKAREKSDMVKETRRANQRREEHFSQQQELLGTLVETFAKIASPAPERNDELAVKVSNLEGQLASIAEAQQNLLKLQQSVLEKLNNQ